MKEFGDAFGAQRMLWLNLHCELNNSVSQVSLANELAWLFLVKKNHLMKFCLLLD